MAAEPLINYKKPEYPKTEYNETGVITRIEYIGATATLDAGKPAIGDAWGEYFGTAKTVTIEPTEDVDVSVLMVTMDSTTDNTDIEPGEKISESYEIRWVTVERNMLEHPAFAIDGEGPHKLSPQDIYDLEKWKAPENTRELREAYSYNERGYDIVLNAPAKMFARGIELGQETFEDKAPIAIKISEYVNGPPPETNAGLKEEPDGVPNIPSGFEWRKETADSTRAGGALKWDLTEEWVGAKKVLHDRENIYWLAP